MALHSRPLRRGLTVLAPVVFAMSSSIGGQQKAGSNGAMSRLRQLTRLQDKDEKNCCCHLTNTRAIDGRSGTLNRVLKDSRLDADLAFEKVTATTFDLLEFLSRPLDRGVGDSG